MTSDYSWDAADCFLPNDGAAQVDNIRVYLDTVLEHESTSDSGDTAQWAEGLVGVGDFAALRPGLTTIEICPDRVESISPDLVHRRRHRARCRSLTNANNPEYPYVVNYNGGRAGVGGKIFNVAISPELTWPGGDYKQAILEFTGTCTRIKGTGDSTSRRSSFCDPPMKPSAIRDGANGSLTGARSTGAGRGRIGYASI